MAKTRSKAKRRFMCSACGMTEPKWYGKCPHCNAWDTLEEVRFEEADDDTHLGAAADHDSDSPRVGINAVRIEHAGDDASPAERHATGIDELDRVFGGGIVRGSVTLLGGDPGIGKSTLLLQALGSLSQRNKTVLYVTAEESAEQVRLRGERLGVVPTQHQSNNDTNTTNAPGLYVLADTNLARIAEQSRRLRPDVLVIDSIQMIYKADLDASPGSVAQLRRCCTELVYLAKGTGAAVVLVGHVTKEGTLAGPRMLEHLVDVVLYFEGDRYHAHRVVRSIKNRFGTTLEIGLFEMSGRGLQQVTDAGASAHHTTPRPGSAVCPVVSGSRCVLVEMQALTATGFPGSTKRKASGIDANRLAMLIAVLEAHAGLRLYDRDVFASAVGGIRVTEPAADAALALAIAGSHTNRTLPPRTAVLGEIGLGGELRTVTQPEARLRETARLGYTTAITPPGDNLRNLAKELGITAVQAPTVARAIEELQTHNPSASG